MTFRCHQYRSESSARRVELMDRNDTVYMEGREALSLSQLTHHHHTILVVSK